MGKATLAHTIALELGVSIRSTSGPALERPGDLAPIIADLHPGDVLLIEQIESLREPVLNVLLEAVEGFTFSLVIGQGESMRVLHLDLPRFTLIGTTSKPSLVDKRLRRWLFVYDFAPYSLDHIGEVMQLLAQQENRSVNADAAHLLARYCDGSIGNARVLIKRVITRAAIQP